MNVKLFTMLNNKNTIFASLKKLGLSNEECEVYVSLLEKSGSHLEVARRTGVNRTKVYRIADELEKRGLITDSQTDTGRQLMANDPANLEIGIKTEEARVERKKKLLGEALPGLQQLFSAGLEFGDTDFEVNTYEGSDGFKQMLWNELKTKDEILIFGSGSIKDLVDSQTWAEKHRQKTLEANYVIREILNPDGKPNVFTANQEFVEKVYQRRYIEADILPLRLQLCIYNDVVAIYNWRDGKKVGLEIKNKSFAQMQRAIFEQYWSVSVERG